MSANHFGQTRPQNRALFPPRLLRRGGAGHRHRGTGAAIYGAPVYVRHEIVHNRYVVDSLKTKGAIFVEELDEIPDNTNAPVVFSAHGVPKSVPADAKRRNFFSLDATCPLVTKVHREAEIHFKRGREIAADRPCRPSGSGRHARPVAGRAR